MAPDASIHARWETQIDKLESKKNFLLTALGRTPAAERARFEEKYAKANTATKESKLKDVQFEIKKFETLLVRQHAKSLFFCGTFSRAFLMQTCGLTLV